MKLYTESSPHIKDGDTTQKIMLRVIIALLPAIIYSVVLFGNRVILLYLASIITCVLCNIIVRKVRKQPVLPDYASIVTALLLVMTLPPSATITMVVIGGVVAIVFAKEVFGGLGSNIFNPALVGRAFLQVAFPAQMSAYTPPIRVPFLNLFADGLHNLVNTVTGGTQTIDMMTALSQATPLTFMKFTYNDNISTSLIEQIQFEAHYYIQMLLGSTGGAIGETSVILLTIGGIFLIVTKTIDWRIPLGMFISLFTVSLVLCLAMPGQFASPIYQVFAGGFVLGAFFMATDMVTCPSSHLGAWIYALLIGAVLAILRAFGSSPEYTMYSILIGNMFMPLISMYTRPKPFGKKEAINLEQQGAKQ
ncbi:RnfABCDGE type electron transport complex subunit D [uncultured Brachyspira sp.]|uniref:RnfABCDGE type electron transport complex subunit D n=1 Tax=uncultured Brachyspira sp. TaxID=221953 RepID=UPI0025DEDA1F|nr:RnfABCDGE type electron transport complex subunit D [uncultured Brachyspira sp.]